MKRVLLTATVQSHIAQFHKPLIEMLHQNNYEVHVAARNNLAEKNGLSLETPDMIYDIPFDRSPLSKNNIMAYNQLKSIIRENKYDIIHCNTPMGGALTRLAAKSIRKYGTKVYYTAHGFHFYKGAPLKNWLLYYPIEKWLANYTDKLITITEEDYKIAYDKFNTSVYHVHGVGANSEKYFSYSIEKVNKLKNKLGYSKDQFILLCTGELNKNKNQSTIIRAVAEVVNDIPNIKLLLAGNGPMEQALKSLVNELNLNHVVDFLGYRTDLENYVNICDIVISASYREGLPLNIMEGMLCGKPIIASSNRGHRELVKSGINGYILSPNDIKGFSEYIEKLYKDYNLIKSLGTESKSIVQKFTIKHVVNELKCIYDSKI